MGTLATANRKQNYFLQVWCHHVTETRDGAEVSSPRRYSQQGLAAAHGNLLHRVYCIAAAPIMEKFPLTMRSLSVADGGYPK